MRSDENGFSILWVLRINYKLSTKNIGDTKRLYLSDIRYIITIPIPILIEVKNVPLYHVSVTG